jgi:hypothetical protein
VATIELKFKAVPVSGPATTSPMMEKVAEPSTCTDGNTDASKIQITSDAAGGRRFGFPGKSESLVKAEDEESDVVLSNYAPCVGSSQSAPSKGAFTRPANSSESESSTVFLTRHHRSITQQFHVWADFSKLWGAPFSSLS